MPPYQWRRYTWAWPGNFGSEPGQSMAEIIDNIDYKASKSQ